MQLRELAILAAKTLAGKDWHRLTTDEKALVAKLQERKYLTVNSPVNGFVGKVAQT